MPRSCAPLDRGKRSRRRPEEKLHQSPHPDELAKAGRGLETAVARVDQALITEPRGLHVCPHPEEPRACASSRRMAPGCLWSILRDAAKRPLLRMRAALGWPSERLLADM